MATMDAVQYMGQMKAWERRVKATIASDGQAGHAFESLLIAVSRQIADRDAEIQRLRAEAEADRARINHFRTELEIARDELTELKANRRGIIGQAHSDRADLYEAQDRLEQMGESERY